MAPSDYISAGSGKLKLKGVKDAKVDKKKKKKSSSSKAAGQSEPSTTDQRELEGAEDHQFKDRSVMLRKLEEEDQMIATEAAGERARKRKADLAEGGGDDDGAGPDEGEQGGIVKTEAERRYEEQRRRRVRSIPSLFPPTSGRLLLSGIRNVFMLTYMCDSSLKNA